jgi:HD-GYP domain-containing protein (c-di-GMP phosphodiesterase class II)
VTLFLAAIFLLAAVFAFFMLRETRRARERAEEALRQSEAGRERERRELESRVRELEERLGEERALRSRAELARQAEREWGRELQARIWQLHREGGSLGDPDDVRGMLLRIAVTLLEAGKGMLMVRSGEDGPLELACSEGFENDPTGSAVAQHFAGRVLERDAVVRKNDPAEIEAHSRTPADEELKNLIALPIYVQDEFNGVVVCANKEGGFDDYDDEVLLSLGDQAGAVLQNTRLQEELRDSYLATVRILAQAIEAKDPFLLEHAEEVSGYVAAVAKELGLDSRRREELVFGSLLHDVGKIGISERILLKPAPLTPEEFSAVKLHPRIGYGLLKQIPALEPIAPAVLHHHERYDGGGYPSGLRGEEIPLEARIIFVADAYSAMTSERPYRRRLTPEEACAELERNAGTQFDPEVVRLFVEQVRRASPDEKEPSADTADPELRLRRAREGAILGRESLALTDNLTLLYSRRYLYEMAQAEAQRAAVQDEPFAVVLLELTGMEELNRREGYAGGDAAIRTVARLVQEVASRHGATACRYSGRRLGILVRDARSAELLAAEVVSRVSAAGSGPGVRAATAVWRPGQSGADVIGEARAGLATTTARSR